MSDTGILIPISQAPVVFLFFYVYFQDKQGYEPFGLLIRSFIAGAVSLGAAVAIEIPLLGLQSSILGHGHIRIALDAVLFISLVEELCKFIALYLAVYRKPDFNEPYDGIMYAVSASLGFAALENLLYCIDRGMTTAILRIFTAVPMHAMSGVLMGYYIGLAKFNPPHERRLLLAGLVAATIGHGLYDYFLLLQSVELIPLSIIILVIQLILGWKAIRHHRNLVLTKPQSTADSSTVPTGGGVDPAIAANTGILGIPLRWATLALRVLGAGAIISGFLLHGMDQVVTYHYLGVPYDSDAILLFLIPAGFSIWTLSGGLSQLRPAAWKLAVVLFFLLLPTPLFPLALTGIYGVLHPETRQAFGHTPAIDSPPAKV